MTLKLFFEAIIKFALGVILVGAFIFLPAGTMDFYNGWLFMAVLFVPMFLAGIVMMVKNPALLRSRLDAKEKQGEQQNVVKLSGLMFILGFVLTGLDFRMGWSNMPMWLCYTGCVILLISYGLFAEVLRENTWLSRTIEVQEGQTVVSTGLYGIVRHPMYFATVFLFMAMPVILGSYISFVVFLMYPYIISKRIKNEEEVLEKELKGYSEYKKKVKYRIIPWIW
ncbi:MAG: isoprenylcysteine carboxylmethyltransferase family protein [Clostridia bacterium]|nr:isoprenylcysteine carboxylmethyltransferase family protein [Clostridia bacterium]